MANAKIDTKEAVAEINKLIDQFNLLIKVTGDVSTISKGNFRKVETALEGLKKISSDTTNAFKKMGDEQKRNADINNTTANMLNKTAGALNKIGAAAVSASKDIKKVTDEGKNLEKQTKNLGNPIKGLVQGLRSLVGAFGLLEGVKLFGGLFADAYKLLKTFDSISKALEAVTKNSLDTAAAQRFLIEITKEFGVELAATSERYVRFLAAAKQSGITIKETEDIFRSMTKAGAVLGLQTDDLATVYLALEQMMSKGKVTTEELRRQLGEKLPGAVGLMARAIGVTVGELDTMLKKGEVLSADALPKLARVVEETFTSAEEGIKSVVAEQNRLTNVWERFVLSVQEGAGVIGVAMKAIRVSLSYALDRLTPQSFLNTKESQDNIIKLKNEFLKQSEEAAVKSYDKDLALDKRYASLKKKAKDDYNKYVLRKAEGAQVAELSILEEQYVKSGIVADKAREQIDAIQQATAIKNLANAQKEYDDQKKLRDKAKKDIDEESGIVKIYNKGRNLLNVAGQISQKGVAGALLIGKTYQTSNEERLKSEQLILDEKEAQLEVARLLSERSVPVAPGVKPSTGRAKGTFEIKPVNDLSNELIINRLKDQREGNEELLAEDKASYEERYTAALENKDINFKLAESAYAEELEVAQKYHDKMLDDYNDAVKKGMKIDGDAVQFKKDLDKNLSDAEKIASDNRINARLNAEQKFASDSLKILERINQDKLDASDKFYNEQIISLNKKYQEGEITYEQLEKGLTKITREQTKARIELQIKAAEALKNSGDVTALEIIKLDEYIAKLKASLENLKPEEDLEAAWTDKLEKIGEIIAELSNFTDAIFSRRIESINAEIEAEKNKYDTLIDLAKGNKDEQVRLQAEKDAKIKQLEAKRLKEEQRAAKYKKAAALVEIAINTAIAVSKVASQTGIFAAAGIGPIILLGAIQAATVLAQPIPQYKGGLRNSPKDHIGMINDGGRKEYIERDGSILSTSTKNAIVELKKGDTVHKSYDDMVNNSNLFSNLSRSIMLNSLYSKGGEIKLGVDSDGLNKVFDKNLKEMKGAIRDGFKNVTINNTTKVDMDWIAYKNNTL